MVKRWHYARGDKYHSVKLSADPFQLCGPEYSEEIRAYRKLLLASVFVFKNEAEFLSSAPLRLYIQKLIECPFVVYIYVFQLYCSFFIVEMDAVGEVRVRIPNGQKNYKYSKYFLWRTRR